MSGEATIASAWAKAVPPTSFRTSEAKEEPGRFACGLAAMSGAPSSGKCGHSLVFGDESAGTIRRTWLSSDEAQFNSTSYIKHSPPAVPAACAGGAGPAGAADEGEGARRGCGMPPPQERRAAGRLGLKMRMEVP